MMGFGFFSWYKGRKKNTCILNKIRRAHQARLRLIKSIRVELMNSSQASELEFELSLAQLGQTSI